MTDGEIAIESWQSAELFAAAHLRTLGFVDASITPSGVDGGVDVQSADVVAQVKHHSAAIGAPVVQQLAGIAHARKVDGVFYSLSGYTRAAVTAGEETRIALYSYSVDGAIAAWTTRARELADFGHVAVPAGEGSMAREEFVDALHRYGQQVADLFPIFAQRALSLVADWRSDPASFPGGDISELLRLLQELQRMASEFNEGSHGSIPELVAKVMRFERLLQHAFVTFDMDYAATELETRR